MIKNSFIQFQESIDALKEYLSVSSKQQQTMINLFDDIDLIESQSLLSTLIKNYEQLQSLRSNIDYSAIVILLYGALERYIEDIAKEYLRYLCNLIDSYKSLPQKIRDNHLQKSLDLLNNLKLDKYENIEQAEIIENLYLCQSSDSSSSYKLNFDAYTQHTANFRYKAIHDFFQELGIEKINQQILKNENFKEYLIQNESYTEESLVKINELVKVRNQIAHGQSTDEVQRLEISLYIDFIEQYIKALQAVLLDQILPFEIQKKGVKLGEVIKVINNSIICVRVSNLTLKIGARIASYNPNAKSYSQGKIISIQVDNEDKQQISVNEQPIDIGIKVDFKVKNNQEFYLIR